MNRKSRAVCSKQILMSPDAPRLYWDKKVTQCCKQILTITYNTLHSNTIQCNSSMSWSGIVFAGPITVGSCQVNMNLNPHQFKKQYFSCIWTYHHFIERTILINQKRQPKRVMKTMYIQIHQTYLIIFICIYMSLFINMISYQWFFKMMFAVLLVRDRQSWSFWRSRHCRLLWNQMQSAGIGNFYKFKKSFTICSGYLFRSVDANSFYKQQTMNTPQWFVLSCLGTGGAARTGVNTVALSWPLSFRRPQWCQDIL